MFTAPLTLLNGITITLHAWGYRDFSARYADYLNLVAALAQRANTPGAEFHEQLLLERVLAHSVPSVEDQALITVPDVPEILETIFNLNRIEEMAAKPLGLQLRRMQAMETAQAVAMEQRPALDARVKAILPQPN